jgi:hypothetical protein
MLLNIFNEIHIALMTKLDRHELQNYRLKVKIVNKISEVVWDITNKLSNPSKPGRAKQSKVLTCALVSVL